MSLINSLAKDLGVTPQELKNLGTLFGLAIVSGIALFIARGQVPRLGSFAGIRSLEFSLAYILLGLLPVLFVRTVTPEGKAVVVFLFTSVTIGLLAAPQFDGINLVVSLLVLFGGFTYYGVSASASNKELIWAVIALLGQGYLYLMAYAWAVLQTTGELRLPVLSAAFLTLIAYTLWRFLRKELAQATAGTGWRQ